MIPEWPLLKMTVRLHWADYLVFLSLIVISCAIGVYFSCGGRSKANNADYLLGGRQMGLLPVILSLAATYISGILFLGYPAETFAYGIQYWIGFIGQLAGCVMGIIMFVPIFYPLKLTSVNEYLFRRYESRAVQMLGCVLSLIAMLLLTGMGFNPPSLALEAVSGVPPWVSIIVGMLVTMFYTTIGGIRVVMYTDSFQAVVMLIGMVAVIAQATYKVGPSHVWEFSKQYHRLNFFIFDPTERVNFWALTFGNTLTFCSVYTMSQVAVQRYSSLPTIRQARIALLSVIPCVTILATMACFSGIVIFAYYAKDGCDPLASGKLNSANKIMMYFAADTVAIPTIPGLFMAAVWAGPLSSASSALNSAAALLWEDFIKRHVNVSDTRATLYVKGIVIAASVVSLGFSLLILHIGGNIIEIMSTFAGSLAGPASALFLLGGFFPWTNWKGATAGLAVGLVYGIWLSFGSFIYKSKHPTPPLPAPTYDCPGNFTPLTTVETFPPPRGLDTMYAISLLWVKGIVMAVSAVVMIIVSFVTGHRDPNSIPPELLHPWVRRCIRYHKDSHGKQEEESAITKPETNETSKPDYEYPVYTNESFEVDQSDTDIDQVTRLWI